MLNQSNNTKNKHYSSLGEFEPRLVFNAWANHNARGLRTFMAVAAYFNILKYTARMTSKSPNPTDWLSDITKLMHYTEMLKEQVILAAGWESALDAALQSDYMKCPVGVSVFRAATGMYIQNSNKAPRTPDQTVFDTCTHAEERLLKQLLRPIDPEDIVFCTKAPCLECAKRLYACGMRKLICPEPNQAPSKWVETQTQARDYLTAYGVVCQQPPQFIL